MGARWAAALAAGALAFTAAAAAQPPVPEQQQPETRAPSALIAFTADRGIHTIAADGSGRRRLASPPSRTLDEDPAWSPDGSTIAFSRLDLRNDTQAIWLMSRDGSGLSELKPAGGSDRSGPAWSPDGQRIAFVTHEYDERRDRGISSLVTVRPDGSDARTIHRETNVDNVVFFADPAWSPTGDRILFTRVDLFGGRVDFVFGNRLDSLHAVSSAGGTPRRVVANGQDAAWSPNGERIVYSAQHDRFSGRLCTEKCVGSGEVYVANADGSGRIRITNSRADDRAPSWSGDGLRIAFQSDRNSTQAEDEESPPELYSMRADGSCLTWLTNGTAHSESPDFERGAGLSSDPGGCGAVPREPLVETAIPKQQRRPFTPWWLGRVASNGLLLTDVGSDDHTLWFGYHDCGRFDPKECGDFVNVSSLDLCVAGNFRSAWRPDTTLSLARGALYQETMDERDNLGFSVLFTHRTRVVMDTASGTAVDRGIVDGLRRFPDEQATGGNLPSTRLPVSAWRRLRTTRGVSRREAARRRAVARRLAQLGVKRRLSC